MHLKKVCAAGLGSVLALAVTWVPADAALGGLPDLPSDPGVVIQPGASIRPSVAGQANYCTLAWIFDGQDGSVYAALAQHCVTGLGQRWSIADGSLTDPVLEFGSVAYVDDNLDYAFIKIDTGALSSVNPALAGHPEIPTGISTTATAKVGDLVLISGHGVATDGTTITQQNQYGVLQFNNGLQHYSGCAASPGDSGGPIADVTDGNKALGIVNTLDVSGPLTPPVHAGEGGLSLQGMLADAAAGGLSLTLRTV